MAAVVADNGSDDAPRVELLETVFVVMKGREERREEREEKRGKRGEEEATKERRGETREKREEKEREEKEREERERERGDRDPPCVDSTRLPAYRQHASVCTDNRPACVQHAGLLPVHTEAC